MSLLKRKQIFQRQKEKKKNLKRNIHLEIPNFSNGNTKHNSYHDSVSVL